MVVIQNWPDGSVLNADIMFPVNSEKRHIYLISYGPEIRRKKSFPEPAVLPVVTFAVAGAPKQSEDINLEVGQINVRVDKSVGVRYYWNIVPLVLLLSLTWYRTKKVNQMQTKG